MAALSTPVYMAAESCRAAVPDGAQHLQLRPCEMVSVPFDEPVAGCADNVGHLEGGPAHFFTSLRERLTSSGADTGMASSGFATAVRCRCERCRYTIVCSSFACPRSIWIVRRSAPASSM